MNLGQLCTMIRADYLVDAKSVSKVLQGAAVRRAAELTEEFWDAIEEARRLPTCQGIRDASKG